MMRDWLMTLLAVSLPYLVAMAIVALATSRRSAATAAVRRGAEAGTIRRRLARTREVAVPGRRRDAAPSPPPQRRLGYPLHKVVAAVERAEADGIVAALGEAGFDRDRVEVITAEEVQGLTEPIGGFGLHGLLTRLQLSVGDDLDELELVRRELVYGHALVQVLVRGDEELERARVILGGHGGHAMRYFGRWTIAPLDGGAD